MRFVLAASALSLLIVPAAFAQQDNPQRLTQYEIAAPRPQASSRFAAAPKSKSDSLVVPIKTSTGEDAGTATFKEAKDGKQLSISLKLKNLPFGDHAVHIHQNPTCDAPDFKGAGGHFNPDAKQHGTMNPMGHHNGDLPQNVKVGENHMGEASFKVDYLTLAPGAPNSILGHSIMVHEKADDMKTDPTGNAGNRIACGVINAPTP